MKLNIKHLFFIVFLFFFMYTNEGYSQNSITSKKTQNEKKPPKRQNWTKLARSFNADFFQTPEALEIADQLLLYQLNSGGWPKDTYFPAKLSDDEKVKLIANKGENTLATIDNNATTTEITYLAKVYQMTPKEEYKNAILQGIHFIFELQYDNGGWPQFHPSKVGYYEAITYNDNAMTNVLYLLKAIHQGNDPYTFLSSDIQEQAINAFNKGIECILNTQVVQDGKLTVWCAQHDQHTLEPTHARSYELPSLSGSESADIVLLLMQLENPSPRVQVAIKGAVEWFKKNQITNLKKEYFTDNQGRGDYKTVFTENGKPMWGRFYDLETHKPFFCSRDGIKRASVSDISYERRNGYGWYTNRGIEVLDTYKKWLKRIDK